MNRADVQGFMDRDWTAIEEMKARFWIEDDHRLTAAQALALGDNLRRYAQSVRPDWPDPDDRAADLAVHLRLTEALRAVPVNRSR
jgi:hypothetical protein